MEIKKATLDDVEAFFYLEENCFPDPWSRKSLRDTLNESASFLAAAWEDEKIIGYLNSTYVLDEMNLNRICVLPEYRKRKAASQLMNAMFHYAKENKINSIFLEVRQSNVPAQRLYEQYEFKIVGKRKKFYTCPTEDGLVMMAKLS